MSNTNAVIETSMGNMRIELFKDKVPDTVNNFIKLAKAGFYNGTIFHRVIPGFMIQGGDPTGTGSGGPGYKILDEFHPDLKHDMAGMLSMANAGPNTGGSQFFITAGSVPWLDGRHSVFGKVTQGLDIAMVISKAKRDERDRPVRDVTIRKITVF